jgi:hypothetical protein
MEDDKIPNKVGFSGHQGLPSGISDRIRSDLAERLSELLPVHGYTSLAEGSDQMFARLVTSLGGRFSVIIPCHEYEATFRTPETLDSYRTLLSGAASAETLDFSGPSEQAFWTAGKRIVELSDRLLAVWDGLPARGLGGTADVVGYAKSVGKAVEVFWPSGATR